LRFGWFGLDVLRGTEWLLATSIVQASFVVAPLGFANWNAVFVHGDNDRLFYAFFFCFHFASGRCFGFGLLEKNWSLFYFLLISCGFIDFLALRAEGSGCSRCFALIVFLSVSFTAQVLSAALFIPIF
jgi:hypothetical protein